MGERWEQVDTEKCLPRCLAHAKCSVIRSYLFCWWKKLLIVAVAIAPESCDPDAVEGLANTFRATEASHIDSFSSL